MGFYVEGSIMKTEDIPRLEHWSLNFLPPDGYTAPENIARGYITGEVYGHNKYVNGCRIDTAYVVDSNEQNRVIETRDGNFYKLGKPDNLWLRWMDKNGHKHDGSDTFVKL